ASCLPGCDAVEEVGDQAVDEAIRDGFVGDQEPVVDRSPELVHDDLQVDVGTDLADLLSAPQPFAGETAALGRIQAPICDRQVFVGLGPPDQFGQDPSPGSPGHQFAEGAELA